MVKMHAFYPRPAEGVRQADEVLAELRAMPFPVTPQPGAEPTPGIYTELEPVITTNLEGRVIDVHSADGGETNTQDQWIAYFNKRGKRMMSASDIYMAGKSGDTALLVSLQKDFNESCILTSTRIEYGAGLNATITHNYGSTVVQPGVVPIIIPEYRPWLLDDVLQTNEGLHFMQVFFGTTDSSQQIKDTLKRLSNSPLEKTKVWSVKVSARPMVRASGFDYSDREFIVNDFSFLIGRARGVSSNP